MFGYTTTSTSLGGRHHRMSLIDRLWLGGTTVVAAGPVELPEREQLVRALLAIAEAGPEARVGLGFGASGREWRYDPARLAEHCDTAVSESDARTPEQLEALMSDLGRTGTLDRPLRVVLAGSTLVLAVRHALGDARFVTNLIDTLLRISRGGTVPEWLTQPVDTHPLRSALMASFVRDRSRAALLARQVRAAPAPAQPPGPAPEPAPRVPFVASPVVVNAAFAPESRVAMMKWAKAALPGATQSSVMLAAVQLALADAGIECTDTTHMVCDARRFLPEGHVTRGNFVIGLDLPVPGTDPVGVSAATARAYESGRPLAAMAAAVAKQLRPAAAGGPVTVPAAPRAQLALSFIGKLRAIEELPWSVEEGERRYYCRVEPAGPTAITLVPTVLGRRTLLVSASFHASVFDPAVVRAALKRAGQDPIGVLSALGGG